MARTRTDIKTRYEFLIAGLIVLVLCICAFSFYRITKYTRPDELTEPVIATTDGDGKVVIEVEISQETSESLPEDTDPTEEDDEVVDVVNIHDDITIFTTTTVGDNYYRSRDGRLALYSEPKDTDGELPTLQEDRAFEVLGFSRDGWAAIELGGIVYYVKSADIVKTTAPEDATEKHIDPENSQAVRFFTPNSPDDIEYVVKGNTRAFRLPDVMSSGNVVDLKAGERVIVVATSGDWSKIIYMNAEYYVLNYLLPRQQWIEEHPDEVIVDNTGYAPVGSDEAIASAEAASGDTDADPATVAEGSSGNTTAPSGTTASGSGESGSSETTSGTTATQSTSDPYAEANATAPAGYARDILTLTNEERRKLGYAPLVWSNTLASCASARAAELPLLTNEQNANHQRPDGSEWYTVNGYTYDNSPMWAENIAYGQTSAQEVFNAWLNSSGHRANMLNPDYKTFAVALYQTDSGYCYYWIEEFGY